MIGSGMAIRLLISRIGRAVLTTDIFISVSGTRFCYRQSKPQGVVRLKGVSKLIKIIRFIGYRTRDLLPCSVVPQPLRYRVSLQLLYIITAGRPECKTEDAIHLQGLQSYCLRKRHFIGTSIKMVILTVHGLYSLLRKFNCEKYVHVLRFPCINIPRIYEFRYTSPTYIRIYVHACAQRSKLASWGAMLEVGRSRVVLPLRSLISLTYPDPCSRTTALGLTPPLTEMSTIKSFWEVKRGRRVRLTTSPPCVSRLWGHRRLITLPVSTDCYGIALCNLGHGVLSELLSSSERGLEYKFWSKPISRFKFTGCTIYNKQIVSRHVTF
jgi:hypothetical protein